MFDVIDEEPLGAASLAQCHRGVLKNGQIVAIKIQHPHVLKNGFTDMETVDVRREREREREREEVYNNFLFSFWFTALSNYFQISSSSG